MPATPAPVRIRLRSLPPAAGLYWIRRGFRTFWRRPIGFTGLFLFVLSLALFAAMVLPPALRVATVALWPLMSLGFMIATEDVLNDLPLRPSVFWAPMVMGPPARRSLVAIGILYGIGCVLIVLLGDTLDGGEARRWMEKLMTPRTDGKMPEIPPIGGIGLAVLLLNTFSGALVSIPLWHAPALVHWGRQRTAQALFSSLVSIWRTRAAFFVFGAGWLVIVLLYMQVIALGVNLLGPLAMSMPMLTGMLVLTATFYVSLWFGFVDTFEITSTVAYRTVKADTDPDTPAS